MAQFPMLTGQVVKLLGCQESSLHRAVRAGVAHPATSAGRRFWSASDVLAVARHLGLDSLPVRQLCQEGDKPHA